MAPLAETSDVEALWRKLDPVVEEPKVNRHLMYASAIVRKRFPTVDARITAGELDAALVTDIVASMVVRYMRSSEGESRNDTQPTLEAAQIALTDDEVRLLEPVQIGNLAAMGTMRTTPSLQYCDPCYPATRRW